LRKILPQSGIELVRSFAFHAFNKDTFYLNISVYESIGIFSLTSSILVATEIFFINKKIVNKMTIYKITLQLKKILKIMAYVKKNISSFY